MMSKSLNCLLMFVLFFVAQELVQASDALQRIPENALGFIVVRNLAETDSKIESLFDPFDLATSSPLALSKIITKLDEGLDLTGDLVITLLPGGGPNPELEPMVLLPVSSYQAFATSIHADTSGEICRVTLMGEDILVAQDGPFALLMNIEHRATMEEMVSFAAEPVAGLAPLADWLPEQELALVLMPNGIKRLGQQPVQSLLSQRARRRYGYSLSKSILQWFDSQATSPKIRQFLQKNVELLAIGITVDGQSNIRLSQQLLLRKDNPLARTSLKTTTRRTPQLGLSDQPNVFTAGGPVLAGWGKQLTSLLHYLDQTQTPTNRRIKSSPATEREKEKAYQLLFKDIQACSVMMLTGKKGEPLCGNFLGVATVPDTQKYFVSLTEVIKIWNKLTDESTDDFKPDFELLKYEAAGKQGHEIAVDFATTLRDPRVPMINWLLEAAFGPEGKLRFQLVQLDEQTFAFGMTTREQMTQLIAAAQQNQAAEPISHELQTTYKLLPPDASWKMLVNPRECLLWIARVDNEFMTHLTNRTTTLPEMPACPPLGISMREDNSRWQIEIVCPASSWQVISNYLQKSFE